MFVILIFLCTFLLCSCSGYVHNNKLYFNNKSIDQNKDNEVQNAIIELKKQYQNNIVQSNNQTVNKKSQEYDEENTKVNTEKNLFDKNIKNKKYLNNANSDLKIKNHLKQINFIIKMEENLSFVNNNSQFYLDHQYDFRCYAFNNLNLFFMKKNNIFTQQDSLQFYFALNKNDYIDSTGIYYQYNVDKLNLDIRLGLWLLF